MKKYIGPFERDIMNGAITPDRAGENKGIN